MPAYVYVLNECSSSLMTHRKTCDGFIDKNTTISKTKLANKIRAWVLLKALLYVNMP